jgi:hypothetical protein
MQTKYIFVTGGVVSGLGKGITAASLGRLLKERGKKVKFFGHSINNEIGILLLAILGADEFIIPINFYDKATKIIREIDLSLTLEIEKYILSSGSSNKNRSMLAMMLSNIVSVD